MRPLYEVAGILQRNIGQVGSIVANSWQARTLYAIAACRTPMLGGGISTNVPTPIAGMYILATIPKPQRFY